MKKSLSGTYISLYEKYRSGIYIYIYINKKLYKDQLYFNRWGGTIYPFRSNKMGEEYDFINKKRGGIPLISNIVWGRIYLY